ncbi:alpha/beta hydrolase family protein [Ectopseudomonas mendocina]|uniref:Alpha/beta hydrolase family protein n=1 Tax=Ectopseudomonas mendocina TaxID=300 RepID=A0ABZ2RK17_ECTME
MSRLKTQLPLCLVLCASLTPLAWAEEPPTEASDTQEQSQPVEVERPPIADRTKAEAQALEHQLDKKEQQQLQAGDETFLALWLPANVGEPSGAVILLPGDDESADWPKSAGPLRKKLPDAGWHTLSVTLPSPVNPISLKRPAPPAVETEPSTSEPTTDETQQEETADTAPSTATESAPIEHTPEPEELRKTRAEHILQRVDAAIAYAEQQQAKTIVLLGHGTGAYWAARYLSERKPASVKNLLLVAAKLPEGYSPALEELIPQLKLATGDFYYKDQDADRQSALKRSQASKRQKHPAYIQIAMKALPGNPDVEQEQLNRRIRGWLSTIVQANAE